MREIKCYALHIAMEDFNLVYNNITVANIIKKHDGAVLAMSKDPQIYCATFLFKTTALRDKALKDLRALGIWGIKEHVPAFVSEQYVSDSWKKGGE